MNFSSLNTDVDDLYFHLYPSPFPSSAHSSTATQAWDSTLGLLNDIITDSSLIQNPSLPMQSYYTGEAHEGFEFLTNFPQVNQPPAALSGYPLPAAEVPPTLQNSSLEVPYSNYQELTNYSHSSLLAEVGSENGLRVGDNEVQNSVSNVEGNQTRKKSSQNGKNNPQVRRRGHRKRPNRLLSDRTSIYRGVSRYNARFEAFLWDNTDPIEKPKTVYVAGFDDEENAARAYDLAALKLWGKTAPINFPLSDYEKELEEMQHMTKKEYLLSLRRKSKSFSKGISIYRGVSRNSDNKKWQARLGKGKGVRGLYLGTFDFEEEAGRAYDVAAIRLKGMNAITNFPMSNYNIKNILASAKIPIGRGASKLLMRNSVEDVLLKKKLTGKIPKFYVPFGSSSGSHPNLQKQSFEQLQALAATKNQNFQFQQNYFNDTNQVLHQNPSSSFLYATNEMNRIDSEDCTNGNLSEGYNLGFPINGVFEGHSMDGLLKWNQQMQLFDQSEFQENYHKYINQDQLQSPSLPKPNGYQNPNCQNPNFLHGSLNVESGLESDGIVSGILNGQFQQVEPLEQFQSLPCNQNFQFHQHRNKTNQCQDQNLESPIDPNLLNALIGVQGDNNENFNSTVGELPGCGFSKGSLTVMETKKDVIDGSNDGFPIEGPIMEGNSALQSVENGEWAEVFGQDNAEFEIPSSWFYGDFLDEFPLF